MDFSRTCMGLLVVLSLSAMAMSTTACGNDPVSASSVDRALTLMTVESHPDCVMQMDYHDGYANFGCGDYFCDARPRAKDRGYGHVIEGATYYSCDDRYSARARFRATGKSLRQVGEVRRRG